MRRQRQEIAKYIWRQYGGFIMMYRAERSRKDAEIRKEFPILTPDDEAYLDNSAATVQKPQCVLDAVEHYYQTDQMPIRSVDCMV
jgi:selenocysteine lyase/cysteine desulfurase